MAGPPRPTAGQPSRPGRITHRAGRADRADITDRASRADRVGIVDGASTVWRASTADLAAARSAFPDWRFAPNIGGHSDI